jgi:predicted site-specific integrase-resolvase
MHRNGQIPSEVLPTGTILVRLDDSKPTTIKTVVYVRVSSSQNRSNLKGQAERVSQFCNKNGWVVDEIIKEVGSGVNAKRKKLNKILSDKDSIRLVVEHKDRLTRFGFEYIEKLIQQNGGEVVVLNSATSDTEDLISDLLAIVYSFTARLYSKRRAKKVKTMVQDAIS